MSSKSAILCGLAATLVAAPGSAAAPAPGQAVVFVDHDLHEPFGIDFDAAGRAYIVQMTGNRVSVVGDKGARR
jgi:hypothetical protein